MCRYAQFTLSSRQLNYRGFPLIFLKVKLFIHQSRNRPATQAAFRPPLTRSAQPLANNTVASIAPSKKATLSKKCGFPAWPGGEELEEGRRPSQL